MNNKQEMKSKFERHIAQDNTASAASTTPPLIQQTPFSPKSDRASLATSGAGAAGKEL